MVLCLISSHPLDIRLRSLQEGCLGSLAHANQQLLRPPLPSTDETVAVRCVPRGGAQMLRLLSSTALRDATGGRLPEGLKHLARWRDTGPLEHT